MICQKKKGLEAWRLEQKDDGWYPKRIIEQHNREYWITGLLNRIIEKTGLLWTQQGIYLLNKVYLKIIIEQHNRDGNKKTGRGLTSINYTAIPVQLGCQIPEEWIQNGIEGSWSPNSIYLHLDFCCSQQTKTKVIAGQSVKSYVTKFLDYGADSQVAFVL